MANCSHPMNVRNMYVASPLKIRHIKLRAIFLIHLHIGLFSIEQPVSSLPGSCDKYQETNVLLITGENLLGARQLSPLVRGATLATHQRAVASCYGPQCLMHPFSKRVGSKVKTRCPPSFFSKCENAIRLLPTKAPRQQHPC